MSSHIIPQDSYNHIQDIACGCNPIISVVEGEEICYHNFRSKDVEPLRKLAKKLKAKQIEEAPEEVEEIPLKNMEEVHNYFENMDAREYINEAPVREIYKDFMSKPREFSWEEFVGRLIQNGDIGLCRAMSLLHPKNYK